MLPRLVVSLLFLASTMPAVAQSDTQLTTVPACSTNQLQEWSFIRTKTLGVAGTDVTGSQVGFYGARKRIVLKWGPNWLPMLDTKATLCGTLNHFKFFPGVWGLDREEDWNNFIIPDAAFTYLITDVQNVYPKARENTPKCKDNVDCIEVEVTVHDNFFENPYFTKKTETSSLTGQKLCTYGPWVREKVHGDKPEIHPSELYWWTRPGPSVTEPAEWWLMVLQDNSNRYNSTDDFRAEAGDDPPGPPNWFPWAGSPRTARFRLAFEAPDGAPSETLAIKQKENHSVLSSVEDTGTTHVLRHNATDLITVREEQNTDRVGVRFTEVCRDDSAKRYLGYVELTSRVAVDSGQDGGYQVLRVQRGGAVPGPSPGEAAKLASVITQSVDDPRVEIIPASLRRVERDGVAYLIADIKMDLPLQKAGVLSEDKINATAQMIDGAKSRTLDFKELPRVTSRADGFQQMSFVLRDVPLYANTPVNGQRKVQVRTNEIVQQVEPPPRPALVPEIRREVTRATSDQEIPVELMIVTAGGDQNEPIPTETALRSTAVRELELDVMAAYATTRRDNSIAAEDLSPIVENFNQAIEATEKKDFSKLQRLFGSTQPFEVTQWKFAATNLSTGKAVSVREVTKQTVDAFPNEIRIIKAEGTVINGNFIAVFPDKTRDIYELTATATMKDSYGSTGTIEHRLWNHYLRIKPTEQAVDALLKSVAARSGVSQENLLRSWQVSPSRIPLEDPSVRRGRTFRQIGFQAAQDGKVTFDEFQALVRAAKLITTPN